MIIIAILVNVLVSYIIASMSHRVKDISLLKMFCITFFLTPIFGVLAASLAKRRDEPLSGNILSENPEILLVFFYVLFNFIWIII